MVNIESLKAGQTTEALTASTAQQPGSDWYRLPPDGQLCPRTGMSRGVYYALIKNGDIHSICLRRKHQIRGTRIIFWPSVEAYFRRLLAEQNGEPKAAQ